MGGGGYWEDWWGILGELGVGGEGGGGAALWAWP